MRQTSRPVLRRAATAATTATTLAAALLLGAAPGSATAAGTTGYTKTAADVRMTSALTARATVARFGTAFSGAVIDADSDTVLWRKNGTTALMPASTTKLVTAANALTTFGPEKTFPTTIRQGALPNQVVVTGSGDPSLSSAQLDAMARTTAADLLGRGITNARVWIDDDVFPKPSLATGWKSTYVPDSITAVRGLVRDQRDLADTGSDVGTYVRDRLKAYGVTTVYYAGRVDVARSSRIIAISYGAPLATTVNRMLLHSDNEIAESLHKLVGIARGRGATWTGARAAQASVLSQQDLTASALYDGSGLSRSDRLSALQLAWIVDRGVDTSNTGLWPLRSAEGMPTAGRTGTLSASSKRFVTAPSSCAAGKVWAKTGRLADVVSLAGFTKGADGRVKVFAFVVNGKESTTTLKQSVDLLAATVNGCF